VARAPVDEMGSSGERLSPEGMGHVGVNEQTAHAVIERAYDPLSFPIFKLNCRGRSGEKRCNGQQNANGLQCYRISACCQFETKSVATETVSIHRHGMKSDIEQLLILLVEETSRGSEYKHRLKQDNT
jgi:hypothetical protein